MQPDNSINVELNGVVLTEGDDYYWVPGKLVLKRPRPRAPELTLWEKVKFILKLEWDEVTRPRYPYPDMVVVENWAMHARDVYLLGSPDFKKHVVYEEDLEPPVHRQS